MAREIDSFPSIEQSATNMPVPEPRGRQRVGAGTRLLSMLTGTAVAVGAFFASGGPVEAQGNVIFQTTDKIEFSIEKLDDSCTLPPVIEQINFPKAILTIHQILMQDSTGIVRLTVNSNIHAEGSDQNGVNYGLHSNDLTRLTNPDGTTVINGRFSLVGQGGNTSLLNVNTRLVRDANGNTRSQDLTNICIR